MLKRNKLVILTQDSLIIDVLESMNAAALPIALFEDEQMKFVGIVTDGDIRRGFISGSSNKDSITSIMNKNPEVAFDSDGIDAIINRVNQKFQNIPVLDQEKRIIGLVNYDDKQVFSSIKDKKVCILGLGHVGLTLSLALAEMGFYVYGYDTNEDMISKVRKGQSSFHERDILMYLNRYVNKRLIPTAKIDEVEADIYIITVGTPINPETKIPRIDYIEKAVSTIGQKVKKNDLVILRSTVPVGTSRNVVIPILNEVSGLKCGEDFFLSYAPERTIEGNAIVEIKELPQIIGGFDSKSRFIAEQVFKELTGVVIDVGSLESAEMVKIMNNTFRDVKFGFANEMALLCKDLGLNMAKLVNYANLGYTRDKIPEPSPGVGGACLSKDSYILSYSAKNSRYKTNIVSTARETNESIPGHIAKEIKAELHALSKDLSSSKIFIVGFAFKGEPETSDMRGSTTLDLIDEFIKQNANYENIYGYDPIIGRDEINNLGVKHCDYEEGFHAADAVIFMNNHHSYTTLDLFTLLEKASKDCIFFDGWYMFEPNDVTSINDVSYLGVGCKF